MTAEDILQNYDLKNTSCRKMMLNELLKSDTALSEHEIISPFPDLFDRVTIYRTLKTLEESGAIHKISLNDNCVKYALSKKWYHKNDIHSHFHCHRCHKVLCLHPASTFDIQLPEGYTQHEVSIVIDGICSLCNAQN